MKTTKQFFVAALVATLTAVASQSSFGEAPTGSITNVISDTSNTIFDATLTPLQVMELYITDNHSDSTSELFVTYADAFTQDGKGKLVGSGDTEIAVTNEPDIAISFPGTYTTKGFIKGNNGITSLKLTSKASGTAFVNDANRTMSAMATYLITLDAAAGTVNGKVIAKATASGLGSMTGSDEFSDAIPGELGDGSWTLVLNFTEPNGTKLTGTATVTLATGQVYPFSIKGTYVSSKDSSKLSLKGVDAGLGSVLTVTMQGSNIVSIKGKVAGQIINAEVAK
jgi:hypothetical protein